MHSFFQSRTGLGPSSMRYTGSSLSIGTAGSAPGSSKGPTGSFSIFITSPNKAILWLVQTGYLVFFTLTKSDTSGLFLFRESRNLVTCVFFVVGLKWDLLLTCRRLRSLATKSLGCILRSDSSEHNVLTNRTGVFYMNQSIIHDNFEMFSSNRRQEVW